MHAPRSGCCRTRAPHNRAPGSHVPRSAPIPGCRPPVAPHPGVGARSGGHNLGGVITPAARPDAPPQLPSETPLAFEERQRAEIRRLEAEGRARKRRESEQAAALALATASGRLARGASFKLWKGASGGGGGGRWERLVVEAVGEQQSSRPGFGAVPLYTLSSADEPGKRYDRYTTSPPTGVRRRRIGCATCGHRRPLTRRPPNRRRRESTPPEGRPTRRVRKCGSGC